MEEPAIGASDLLQAVKAILEASNGEGRRARFYNFAGLELVTLLRKSKRDVRLAVKRQTPERRS